MAAAFTQTLTDSQQFNLSIAGLVDKKGNPVTASVAPTWATDNSDILTLTPSADGMSCGVVAKGALGIANVNVAATTPSGDISGVATISVITGAPVGITLSGDTPVEQP